MTIASATTFPPPVRGMPVLGLSSSTMAEVVLPPLEDPSSDPPPQPPVLLLEVELLLELLEPELEPELELLELDPELLELEPELELLDPLELLELLLLPGVSPPPVLGMGLPFSIIVLQLLQ